MATKARPGSATAPKMVKRKINGVTRMVAADSANQTETADATIKRLVGEVKQFSDWWHQDRRKVERLEQRVRQLEGTLRSMANLAHVDLGDLVERPKWSAHDHDEDIPF